MHVLSPHGVVHACHYGNSNLDGIACCIHLWMDLSTSINYIPNNHLYQLTHRNKSRDLHTPPPPPDPVNPIRSARVPSSLSNTLSRHLYVCFALDPSFILSFYQRRLLLRGEKAFICYWWAFKAVGLVSVNRGCPLPYLLPPPLSLRREKRGNRRKRLFCDRWMKHDGSAGHQPGFLCSELCGEC